MIVDFLAYIEILINLFRLAEKIDAAGASLSSIFKKALDAEDSSLHLGEFADWLMNFDVWGSYLPLNVEAWDVHMARAAAHEKLSIFRASLKDFQK